MIVGEPSLMGGEMDDEDERYITRLENAQYEPTTKPRQIKKEQIPFSTSSPQPQQLPSMFSTNGNLLPPSTPINGDRRNSPPNQVRPQRFALFRFQFFLLEFLLERFTVRRKTGSSYSACHASAADRHCLISTRQQNRF